MKETQDRIFVETTGPSKSNNGTPKMVILQAGQIIFSQILLTATLHRIGWMSVGMG